MDLSLFQKLHGPCSGESPSGLNLEYDDLFLEVMRLSECQPEVQYGSTIVPPRLPDWPRVLEGCLDLSDRTRDLRLGVLMVECLCDSHGWAGLASGLELLSNWLTNFWDSIHPQLEADDNYDPTARISFLSRLVSDELLIKAILQLPLVDHRALGTISLRDHIACLSSANGRPGSLTWTEIEAAFDEMKQAEVHSVLDCIQRCIQSAKAIDSNLISRIGLEKWSGNRLVETLERAEQCFLSRASEPTIELPATEIEDVSNQETFSMTDTPTSSPMQVVSSHATNDLHTENSGTITRITSRVDATHAIDSICSYFELNEPASPVPLLLQRAKRLIPMSFIEIIRELAPNESQQMLQQIVASGKVER